jgi:hypothetical protein
VSAYDDNDLTALNRLEDLLDAYCDTRLMPRGPVLSRIRTTVLAEAAAAAATSRLQALASPGPKPARWTLPSPFARRVAALGFAAVLTLGTSAAVLAAPPGSPFYNTRVYLETALLPTQQDARFEGHEKLLEERLAEANAAAASGDMDALAAALAAYQAEVNAATAEAGNDPDHLAHLEAMLATHTDALTALAATLPDESSIDHAIDTSSKAIDKLKARGEHAHPTKAPQGGGGPSDDEQSQNGGAQ